MFQIKRWVFLFEVSSVSLPQIRTSWKMRCERKRQTVTGCITLPQQQLLCLFLTTLLQFSASPNTTTKMNKKTEIRNKLQPPQVEGETMEETDPFLFCFCSVFKEQEQAEQERWGYSFPYIIPILYGNNGQVTRTQWEKLLGLLRQSLRRTKNPWYCLYLFKWHIAKMCLASH